MRYDIFFHLVLSVLVPAVLVFAEPAPTKPVKAPVTKPASSYPLNWNQEGLLLPRVADAKLKKILTSKNTVYYKLPQVYQQYIPASEVLHTNKTLGTTTRTFQKGAWGIFYSNYLPDFNGNQAFPWEGTLGYNSIIKEGLHNKRYGSINMIYLPGNEGEPTPILILNEVPIKWVFPVGTIAGELLWVKDEAGKKWIFEIRCREKLPDSLAWEPLIYRPLKNRQELLNILNYPSDWRPPQTYMFFRNVHEDEVFKMEGMVERIPKIKPDRVREILKMPFVDVTYESWGSSTAPAADEEFSIFPKNYNLGLITPDEQTCAGCHRQTSISLVNLIPKEPLIFQNPDYVANIRGYDGIFTWHPFSDESISDGTDNDKLPTRVRAYDITKKRVLLFKNETQLDPTKYKITKYVQESLKPYSLPQNRGLLH